jgi:hypothetical protein
VVLRKNGTPPVYGPSEQAGRKIGVVKFYCHATSILSPRHQYFIISDMEEYWYPTIDTYIKIDVFSVRLAMPRT